MADRTPLDRAVSAYLRCSPPSLEERCRTLADHGVALLFAGRLRRELTDHQRMALVAAASPYIRSTFQAGSLLERLSPELSSARVRHVVLKGPCLAQAWRTRHGGADTRTFTDVDLLVDPSDVEMTETVLRQCSLRIVARSEGETTWSDETGGLLDLHWLPINDPPVCARFRLNTEQIMNGHTVWTGWQGRLDPVMTLLHTATHATISDLSKLSSLADVDAAACEPDLDWDGLVSTAKSHSLCLLLAVALSRSRRWMATPVPEDLMRDLGGRSAWRGVAGLVSRRSPEGYLSGRWSGGEFYRHTREDSWRSLGSLVGDIDVNLKVQARMLLPHRPHRSI